MSRLVAPGHPDYVDESVPVHPEMNGSFPVVVFGDHRLCAGHTKRVQKMPGPHMHSQIEFNIVSKGYMTYWFDGREVTLGEGRMTMFWGMIPHQVIDCDANTEFTVLYVPMSAFLEFPELTDLRQRIFSGAMLEATSFTPEDILVFDRWRKDLLSANQHLEVLVRDELVARLRRLDHDGWEDLRGAPRLDGKAVHHDPGHERAFSVEKMANYIADHALEDIAVMDVARQVNLHPNYAMSLFRQAIGMTIKQAILRHRLDAARSMLIATDRPVAAIAFASGFGSLSSFYEAFEKRFHTSPREFRNKLTSH